MLADRSDATLSAARVFRRNQTEVRLDLVSLRKALRVVDDRHEHRCDHQADARRRHQKSNHGFVLRELGDLPIDFVELGLERRKHLHQRLANGPHRVGKVALAIVVDEGLGRARSDSLTTRPNDPPDRRDRLSAHLDEASPHHHVCAQRPPVGRQHMRFGNVAGFERPREHFGIDAIRLAAVLTDAELLDPCRIDKLDLVAPTNELVVYVPRLAARLDGDPCLGCVDGEHVVESRERTDRPSRHDLPVLHLAERDLLRAQSRPIFLIADLSWAPSFCVTERVGVPAAKATGGRSALSFPRPSVAPRSSWAGSSLLFAARVTSAPRKTRFRLVALPWPGGILTR